MEEKMQRKARPMDVKFEIMNRKDWKEAKNLDIKVKGMFRDSSWKIKEVTHKITGNIIEIDIISKKLPF